MNTENNQVDSKLPFRKLFSLSYVWYGRCNGYENSI